MDVFVYACMNILVEAKNNSKCLLHFLMLLRQILLLAWNTPNKLDCLPVSSSNLPISDHFALGIGGKCPCLELFTQALPFKLKSSFLYKKHFSDCAVFTAPRGNQFSHKNMLTGDDISGFAILKLFIYPVEFIEIENVAFYLAALYKK